MKLLQRMPFVLSALCCALTLVSAAARADTPSGLEVRDVRSSDTEVTGWVVNHTGKEVRDVRLMVDQQWRWARERQPGDDNPGRGTVVRVEQPIPANGRVQFRYELPQPLPRRDDGHFETAVHVMSFSEHWFEPTAAVPPRAVLP